MSDDIFLDIDAPKEMSSYIKAIGVGGCGTNAINNMRNQCVQGVDFIVCNTDAQHLHSSPVYNKIQLGTSGLGAGTDPEKARNAALEQKEEIKNALGENTRMLFITAGMGKGTGTGASPVVAQIARELEQEIGEEILIVAIVTYPDIDEGPNYKKRADEGIAQLKELVDSIIIIDNEKLIIYGDLSTREAFAKVDDILVTAAKSISEMMTADAYRRVDFSDVKVVLKKSGEALIGMGIASGEDRANQAIKAAITSDLLNDRDYSDAKDVLLFVSSSTQYNHTVRELRSIKQEIRNLTNSDINIISSEDFDNDSLGEDLKVTIVIAGFTESKNHIIIKPPIIPIIPPTPPSIPEPVPFIPKKPITTVDDEKDKRYTIINGDTITATSPKVTIAPYTPIGGNATQEERDQYLEAAKKRIEKINELLKTKEGLDEISNTPSVLQKYGEDFDFLESASKSQASSAISYRNGEISTGELPYLHGNPD
jgi:cell division protein FtsZ